MIDQIPQALSDQEIDAMLARFAHGELTVAQADQAIERLQTARRRVIARILQMLQDFEDRNVAVTLLGFVGDESTVPSLMTLLKDDSVDDDLKLKLISLISELDTKVDTAALLDHMQDPHAALQRSRREHLQCLQLPDDLTLWLEMMQAQMTPQARLDFCQTNIELGDSAAVPVLVCMCYDPDESVALMAIDATERFKDIRALPVFQELAERHPVQEVRAEAHRAADRLRVRALLSPQVASIPPAPLYRCYLSTMDGAGGQVALIARWEDDETLLLVDVMFNDHEGIKQCFGASARAIELEDMVDTYEEQGISLLPVTHGHFLAALDLAVKATWEAKRLLPMAFVAWRGVIEGGRIAETVAFPDVVVSVEDRTSLWAHCHELLLQDEFAFWFFNPEEVKDLLDRYIDLALDPASGVLCSVDGPTLKQLLAQGVREIVDDRVRTLIESRLRRVAPLLRDLYQDPEVWQWAVVAADAMGPDSPVPVQEHPLLLGMVACSLENVLGRAVDWLGAL